MNTLPPSGWPRRTSRRSNVWFRGAAAVLLGVVSGAMPGVAAPVPLDDRARLQIQALQAEKAARTPAQRKMDSQLVRAAKLSRGEPFAPGVTGLRPALQGLADGRVLVDIDADVTDALVRRIAAVGGTVVNRFPRFRAIRALLPPGQIEAIAGLPGVDRIRRAVRARTHAGSATSQGDTAHRAGIARSTFKVNGAGIKVGVLSDSVDYLAASQAAGDLGPVTILPGQDGIGPGRYGEGTAMLEIVHDLAPGAALYFASAFNSSVSFAQNILDLRAAGCDVIIDDVEYYDESPFQDGPIAQAVNAVTAGGALYFSSASNSGNKNDGTSGTWEGDFKDGGPAPALFVDGGRIHDFGGGTNYNTATADGTDYRVDLFWSDPLTRSTNDYDLFVLNATGDAVIDFSNDTQDGHGDPYEGLDALAVGDRIVVIKAYGVGRFLHLSTGRGRLAISTDGSTRGHSAATNAFSVAAVSARYVDYSATPFAGGTNNPVEEFSSDGPRRMFYTTNGVALTPGNVSSTGGRVRQKPDLAAADDVDTGVPGFEWFSGTSAASPHAGAIAALLKSYNIRLTPAQLRAALTNTTLDIEAAGVDRDSGAGLVMAMAALQSVTGAPNPRLLSVAFSDAGGGNGNGVIEPGEVIRETLVWTNSGGLAATGVTAVLTTATPGITLSQASAALGTIGIGGVASNVSPYLYRLARTVPFGTTIGFTNVLTVAGQTHTSVFSRLVGQLLAGSRTTNTWTTNGVWAIPGAGGVLVTNILALPGTNLIDDVDVTVRIDHPYDMDLTIAVRHPDATEVVLAAERGYTNQNYGVGATPTTFDDQAATAVGDGDAPFAGSYRPEGALGVFNGKALNGAWRLRLTDSFRDDNGTLLAWGLRIVSHPVQYLGTVFDSPPVASNQSVTVRSGASTNLVLRGSDADGDPVTFRTNGAPAHGTLSAFNTNSGAITYTAVSNYVGPDSFTFSLHDGLTNGLAATVTVTVVAIDSVGDGIPDWWRLCYFGIGTSTNGTSTAAADPDADGMSNLGEYLTGTVPTNGASVFRLLTVTSTGGNVRVGWQVGGGTRNVLQGAVPGGGGSFPTNFTDISPILVMPGSGDVSTNYTDVGGATNPAGRFYRVSVSP